MQKLEKEVKTNGQTYTLVKRTERVAMDQSNHGHYEVFIIRHLPAQSIYGKEYPEREGYAVNDDFGARAWCTMTEDRAENYYKKLEIKAIEAEIKRDNRHDS